MSEFKKENESVEEFEGEEFYEDEWEPLIVKEAKENRDKLSRRVKPVSGLLKKFAKGNREKLKTLSGKRKSV